MTKDYERMVAGFLFDSNEQFVVLVKKNRPKWQKGKWNGVGGHIEENEEPRTAMRREFREETGLNVNEERWSKFVEMYSPTWVVHFYYAFDESMKVRVNTDEDIRIFRIHDLPENTIPNLRWLIPLALDNAYGLVKPVQILYR